jgi:hypothetical protein
MHFISLEIVWAPIFTLIPKISNKNTWDREHFRKFYREATASFLNIFISFPGIANITLKLGLNIQKVLNLIKYKNI